MTELALVLGVHLEFSLDTVYEKVVKTTPSASRVFSTDVVVFHIVI